MLKSVLVDKKYLVVVYSPQFKIFGCIRRCVYTHVYCFASEQEALSWQGELHC